MWARDLFRVAQQGSAGTTTLATSPFAASPALHTDEGIVEDLANPLP